MTGKKERSGRKWVDKVTEFAGEFKNFSKTRGKQFYFTMSETTAVFSQTTLRSFLICTVTRKTMDANAILTYRSFSKFWFLEKFSYWFDTKRCRNFQPLVHSLTQSLQETRKGKTDLGDRIGISKRDLPIRKDRNPQYTPAVFESVAIETREKNLYTQ